MTERLIDATRTAAARGLLGPGAEARVLAALANGVISAGSVGPGG